MGGITGRGFKSPCCPQAFRSVRPSLEGFLRLILRAFSHLMTTKPHPSTFVEILARVTMAPHQARRSHSSHEFGSKRVCHTTPFQMFKPPHREERYRWVTLW